jgi:16S rRNA (cytosine1402-N4)-methyltransferase
MTVHVSILLQPIVEALVEPFRKLPADAEPHWIVDCTFGGGGHTRGFLEKLKSISPRHRVLSIDQDPAALERGRRDFREEVASDRLELVHGQFSDLPEIVGARPVLGILADLGFSSDQIEDPERGLSFQSEGPLDMRMNPKAKMTCLDHLHRMTESEMAKIFETLGEERFSRRIASSIFRAKIEGHLPRTTRELAELIVKSVPPSARHGRIHPATRVFQALRILVNDELGQLDQLLDRGMMVLKPGGRIAILSFHSLEDRKVKWVFREKPGFVVMTKKPIEADEAEIAANPRSRSAKLRIAERGQST